MKTSKRVGVDLAPAAKIDDPVIKVPRTFQDCIDVIRISRDGDFQVADNKYSRTYEMSEINYRIMSDEAQENIVFDSYSELINSMQDPFKITITNLKSDIALLQKRMFMRHRGDGLDKYRDILNDNINEKMYEGSKGYEQHKYITLSAYASSYADAKDILNVAEKSLVKGMSSFNSAVSRLDSKKRLESLRGIYRMDCKNDSVIDIDKLIKRGDGFKSELANPKGMNFDPEHNQNGTYFTIGDKCVQVLYAADYPSVMTDSFLIDLVTRPVTMIASLDVMPVSREITTKLLEHNYMGIENDIANQQQRHNKQEAYSSQITYKKRVEKASIEEYMTDVAENDQNQYLVGLLICLFADTKDELDAISASVCSYAAGRNVKFEIARYMQREAFNTVLPIGCMQMDHMRTMLTRNVAGFVPFNIQELHADGCTICYGKNQLSNNAIFGNRKKLVNPNGFYFGMPGSGKSLDAKLEMSSVMLGSNDDIMIIDPTNEYIPVAQEYGGEVIVIGTEEYANYINPLDVDLSVYDSVQELEQTITEKNDLMTAICAFSYEGPFDGRMKSLVDRAVRNIYRNIAKMPQGERYVPIISDFRNELSLMKEPQAQDIVLCLERFTDGSMNFFNHQTNIDVHNRMILFSIRDTPKEMWPMTMLIVLTYIDKKIFENFNRKTATWLYIDEFHEPMRNEYVAVSLDKYWRKNRKLGCIDTGMTQNIDEMLKSATARTMLDNSEFFYILKQQSNADADRLCDFIGGVTDELKRYVINAEPGTGLLKHGSVVLPVDNRFDKDNELYKLLNTNFYEKTGGAD